MNVRDKLYKGSGVLPATSLRVVSFELLGCMFDLDLVFKKNQRNCSLKMSGRETFYCLKGAQSRFVQFEKFSLHFSNLSFAIRVNLRHP